MFLIVTIVGVWLGYAYAGLVDRRFLVADRRRWSLLVPVWAAYAAVLATADMTELLPQGIQSFAVATVMRTLVDSLRALRRRRVLATSDQRVTGQG